MSNSELNLLKLLVDLADEDRRLAKMVDANPEDLLSEYDIAEEDRALLAHGTQETIIRRLHDAVNKVHSLAMMPLPFPIPWPTLGPEAQKIDNVEVIGGPVVIQQAARIRIKGVVNYPEYRFAFTDGTRFIDHRRGKLEGDLENGKATVLASFTFERPGTYTAVIFPYPGVGKIITSEHTIEVLKYVPPSDS